MLFVSMLFVSMLLQLLLLLLFCFVLASSVVEAVCNSDVALYLGCLEGKKTERSLIIYPRKFFFPS